MSNGSSSGGRAPQPLSQLSQQLSHQLGQQLAAAQQNHMLPLAARGTATTALHHQLHPGLTGMHGQGFASSTHGPPGATNTAVPTLCSSSGAQSTTAVVTSPQRQYNSTSDPINFGTTPLQQTPADANIGPLPNGICTTVYRWYMYHCVPVVYVQCVYSNDLLFTVYLWYMYSVYSNDVYLLRHAPPSNHHPPTHHHCNLCRSTVLCFVIGKTTRVNDTCQQHVSTTISQNSDSNAHHSANC
eukprot:Lankesteria_metandrocarpae@DN4146_c1_g1_i1.p1